MSTSGVAVPSVVVRDRRDADADALGRALADAQPTDNYPMRAGNAHAGWLFGGDVAGAWVAVVADEVVAHVSVVRGFDVPGLAEAVGVRSGSALGLTRLFVIPAWRGRGAASILLDRAERFAAAAGVPLVLEVAGDALGAIALYEGRGWQRISTYRATWFAPDGPRPIAHGYLAPG
ncbi:GNAT family N-acetyltransferase [Marisediminicola senii]|uniref:GNAT family N-acetyltransferase n=1 Tax=Marisediminicola senii TaxID=2711233 RepID=UPI0013EA39C2|nr:GNAT family N-acetyltransferase [Marisediminicola senii]